MNGRFVKIADLSLAKAHEMTKSNTLDKGTPNI